MQEYASAGRDPNHDKLLEAGRVHFTNFSEGIEVVDPYTGDSRIPVKADLADAAVFPRNQPVTAIARLGGGGHQAGHQQQVAQLAPGALQLEAADLAQRPAPGGEPPPAPEEEMEEAAPVTRETLLGAIERLEMAKKEAPKDVIKEGLSEYFLFTIEGREDIKDKEPKRLVSMKVADVPLECIYKLTDRDGGRSFTKYYRFKNKKLLDDEGNEKDLPAMENLGVSPLPRTALQ